MQATLTQPKTRARRERPSFKGIGRAIRYLTRYGRQALEGTTSSVYFAMPLSVLHYFWLERDIKDWVLVYAALVAVLFAVRLPALRHAITRRRQSSQMIARENKSEVDL